MTLPNFLIVGAAKSGTTTLYDCLSQHPDVFMPKWKEPAYFVADYPRNARSLKEYESIFSPAGDAKAVGEASTPYLYDPDAPAKILDTLGRIKIIIVLRNPVDTAYSLWGWMAFRYGFEDLSFEDALKAEDSRMADRKFRDCAVEWHASFYYFHRGLYYEQVKRYIDAFGRENVLVHIFDEFVADPVRASRETYRFLGLDDSFAPVLKQRNPASAPKSRLLQRMISNPPASVRRAYDALPLRARLWVYELARGLHKMNLKAKNRPGMDPETRRALAGRYREDIMKLESLIKKDLSAWYAAG